MRAAYLSCIINSSGNEDSARPLVCNLRSRARHNFFLSGWKIWILYSDTLYSLYLEATSDTFISHLVSVVKLLKRSFFSSCEYYIFLAAPPHNVFQEFQKCLSTFICVLFPVLLNFLITHILIPWYSLRLHN